MAGFDESDFRIPKCVFTLEDIGEHSAPWPPCPVLVFINSRSGGQLGGDLLKTYRELLNESQVFDLGQKAPEEVLQAFFVNLERLKHVESQGNQGGGLAEHILDKLRLIVAGGDGTASWLLGVVCDLKLARPPPVATVPLGTGNNLPFAFGWGKKNPGTDGHSVKSFLELVKNAHPMDIDNWHLIMRMRTPKEGSCAPLAPLELPYALHAFRPVSDSDSLNKEGYQTFRGGFWNYFSLGMDAQVSYEFHSARKMHPEKFKNQLVNQATYLKLGLGQGLHSSHDSSRNISEMAAIEVIEQAGGEWKLLPIPPNIKSIICLNLPSFSGGLNPWGVPNNRPKYKDFTPPYVNDGRIEVVGFSDALQGLLLLSSHGHGTRLAQAHRIRFKFHEGAGAKETYMRIDGEPWKQPLPTHDNDNEDRVQVEISHHGQVTMLAVPNCRSKAMPIDPGSFSSPSTPCCDDSDEELDEKRKFGAAETFKLPEDIDIAHFS